MWHFKMQFDIFLLKAKLMRMGRETSEGSKVYNIFMYKEGRKE